MSKATTKRAKPPAKKAGKATTTKKLTVKKPVAKPPVKKVVQKAKTAKKPVSKTIVKKKPLTTISKVAKKAPVKKPVKKVASKKIAPKTPVKKTAVKKLKAAPPIKTKTAKATQTKPSPTVFVEPVIQSPNKASAPGSARSVLPAKPTGKIAHAVFPSSHTPINKENKKTVSERALISQVTNQAPNILESDEGANPGFMQNDEVFDETDYAQHLQLMEQADISRRARELNRPQAHPDFDGLHCVECDIVIPKIRLDAGRVRCVECQEEIENESKRLNNLARGRA
jgi:RNA polymerase-binding transcription factor DksA